MKFGALLRTSAGEVPELQELFTAYKQLKKHLKRLPERETLANGGRAITAADARALGLKEADFVATLSADVARFNDMFLEREEDAVIRLRSLEDDAGAAQSAAERKDIYRRFVDFHGEMLLLVHWSILAYTGLVKILKKHHKRTGLLVRAPHLDNLATQPFCSTELMSDLVRKAELDIDALRGRLAAAGAPRAELSAASAYASQSAALLQAARNRSAGGGPLGAAELLAAASDSGSAPGSDHEETSDAETGAATRATAPTLDAAAAAAGAPKSAAAAAAAPGAAEGAQAAESGSAAAGVKRTADDAGVIPAADGVSPAAARRRVNADGPAAAPIAAGSGSSQANATSAQAAALSGGSSGALPRPAAPLDADAPSGDSPGGAVSGSNMPPTALRPPSAALAATTGNSGQTAQPADAAAVPPSAAAAQPPSAANAASTQQPTSPAAGQQRQPQQQPPQHRNVVRSPPRILAQTRAALGLWKELTETASTPSTVLPIQPRPPQYTASSVTTDQSAA